ncbi:hypothetical protein U716_02500 [Rhodobacter capsulatus B6]|nr:hypothetical protein U716_02500 [Rhodobacter capsulatus B6]
MQTASPVTGAIRPVTTGLLRDNYLVPGATFDPDAALALRPRAPWAQSLAVAPAETGLAVRRALEALARATETLTPAEVQPERLPTGRARTHLGALRDLWSDLGGALPEDLQVWRHVIGAEAGTALEPLPLLAPIDCPHATAAETALARALHRQHGAAPEGVAAAWLARQPALSATAPGALGHVQANLTSLAAPLDPDASLQVFGLRDPMEEAEFAAAMVQGWLDRGLIDGGHQAGLLVPEDPAYASALAEAFDRVGLPLSGAPAATSLRDLAGDLIAVLLPVLRGPAPRTALASLVLSPLMPWPAATGRAIARDLISRGYSRLWRGLEGPAAALFDALRPVASLPALFARLSEIDALLASPGSLAPQIALLRSQSGERPDWPALQALVEALPLPGPAAPRTLEGVSVFTEPDLPWRSVRRLIVLGMQGRSWPRPQPANPFFTETEIAQIGTATGLHLPGRARETARRLELFRRQLCAATEAAVLLAPAREMAGARLPPSTALALIARLLGCTDPARLVVDPRALPEGQQPFGLTPRQPDPMAGHPDLPESGAVTLGRDLLALKGAAGADPPPQSPSQLETLIVSPLAWLLAEIDARDRLWAPETLDVLVLGTVVHGVLERVFPPETPPPAPEDMPRLTEAALAETIARKAAWLAEPAWAAERASLAREALRMVQGWARFLTETGAVTLANEISLAGDHGGLLIAGRADGLLRLPDGRHLVIDHKRGSSGKRRRRMELGWDLQVALYRAMLERPGPGAVTIDAAEAPIVTGYHTTLDGAVLTDGAGAGLARAECPAIDPAREALAHLAEVTAEVGAGRLRLNHAGDAARFEKERGITAYALAGDELIAALMLPEAQDAAEEGIDD